MGVHKTIKTWPRVKSENQQVAEVLNFIYGKQLQSSAYCTHKVFVRLLELFTSKSSPLVRAYACCVYDYGYSFCYLFCWTRIPCFLYCEVKVFFFCSLLFSGAF